MLASAPKQFVFICQKYWTNKQGQVCQSLLFFWETKFQCVSWADLWTSTFHNSLWILQSWDRKNVLVCWDYVPAELPAGLQGQLNSTGTRLQLWLQSLTGSDRWDFPADLTVCSKWFQESDQLVFHIFKPLHLQISSCSCSASASAATPAITLQASNWFSGS